MRLNNPAVTAAKKPTLIRAKLLTHEGLWASGRKN